MSYFLIKAVVMSHHKKKMIMRHFIALYIVIISKCYKKRIKPAVNQKQ